MLYETQRNAIRVTPSTTELTRDEVFRHIAALHDVSASSDENESGGFLSSLTGEGPLVLEALIVSEGENQPIELYYTGNNITAIEIRLDQLYPASFEIEQVEFDLGQKLVRPVAFEPEAFIEHLSAGTLQASVEDLAVDNQPQPSPAATGPDPMPNAGRGDAGPGGADPPKPPSAGADAGTAAGGDGRDGTTETSSAGGGLTDRARGLCGGSSTASEDPSGDGESEQGPSPAFEPPANPGKKSPKEADVLQNIDVEEVLSGESSSNPDTQDPSSEPEDRIDPSSEAADLIDGISDSVPEEPSTPEETDTEPDTETAPSTPDDTAVETSLDEEPHDERAADSREDAHRFQVEDTVIEVQPASEFSHEDPLTSIDGPTLTPDGRILARPADGLDPHVIRWFAREEKSQDWMTAAGSATDFPTEHNRRRRHQNRDVEFKPEPIETAMEQLAEASHPMALQVLIEPRPSWEAEADIRVENLKEGRDSMWGKLMNYERESTHASEEERIELIKAKNAQRSFYVNVRLVGVNTRTELAEDLPDPVETYTDPTEITVEQDPLTSLLSPIDGTYYSFKGRKCERSDRLISSESEADTVFRRFQNRRTVIDPDSTLTKMSPFASTESMMILSPRTLAELLVVPSANQFSGDLFRSAQAQHQDRLPLHSPGPEALKQLREGVTVGYPLNDRGEPMDQPVSVPEKFLKQHFGIFASSGSGKSIKVINMLLSMHTAIPGPEILFDPKGDQMSYEYMQAHYERYGTLEHIRYFKVPDDLPVVSFFDIRPALASGRDRSEAIQDRIEHFHSIMEIIMEGDRYSEAYLAKQTLSFLIKALFDEKHGSDAFTVDDLRQAALEMYEQKRVPRASRRVEAALGLLLAKPPVQFDNTMSAVNSRVNELLKNDHIYEMLNQNPEWDPDKQEYVEECLSFRDVFDDNIQLLFDTGEMRNESQQAFTLILLSTLWDDLQWRRRRDDVETQVNLIIEEAGEIAAKDLVHNQLIPRARSFELSLGLVMQFPTQVIAAGGEGPYKEIMHNVQNKFYGKIVNPDDKLDRAIAVDEVEIEHVANKLKHIQPGIWIADFTARHDDLVTTPFSMQALDVPPGHPESHAPLSGPAKTGFHRELTANYQTVSDGHGVVDTATSHSEESLDHGEEARNGTDESASTTGSSESRDERAPETHDGPATPASQAASGSTPWVNLPSGSDEEDTVDTASGPDPTPSSSQGGHSYDEDDPFCAECGEFHPEETLYCPNCQDEGQADVEDRGETPSAESNESDDRSTSRTDSTGSGGSGTQSSETQQTRSCEESGAGVSPEMDESASDTIDIDVQEIELNTEADIERVAHAIWRTAESDAELERKLAILVGRAAELGEQYSLEELRTLASNTERDHGHSATSQQSHDDGGSTDQDQSESDQEESLFEQIPERAVDVTNAEMERYNLSEDDLEFLGLLADAYHRELDWYSLFDSMTVLRDKAGEPDLEHLEGLGFIEKVDTKRFYYSLLPDGWDLIGRNQYNVGDWNEKIKHRVGLVLAEEYLLQQESVVSVEPYHESDSGVVFDLAGFDSEGTRTHVVEVECLNWNQDSMVEDYTKMAAVDDDAFWFVDKGETAERIFTALHNEDIAPESLSWDTVQDQSHLQDLLADYSLDGMDCIHTFNHVRGVIDE